MSTNSSITAKCDDGKFRSVYCHWDGYPEHNGKVLLEDFTDQKKIEQLMSLGDLSLLDSSIECPEGHSFDNKVEGHSIFYGRDRGEDDVSCLVRDSKEECLKANTQEYDYFWDGTEWFVNGKLLADVLLEGTLE